MFPPGTVTDAWPLIFGRLLDFRSDDVVKAVSRAGLNVDWTLTAAEDHSHKTRNRAYWPRAGGMVGGNSINW